MKLRVVNCGDRQRRTSKYFHFLNVEGRGWGCAVFLIVLVFTVGKNDADDYNIQENPEGNNFEERETNSVIESHHWLRAARSVVLNESNNEASHLDFTDSHENLSDPRNQTRDKRNFALLFGRNGRNAENPTRNKEEDARNAEAILRNIVSNNSVSASVPTEVVYFDDQAIAALFTEKRSTSGKEGDSTEDFIVTKCRILEVNKPEEAAAILKVLESEGKLVLHSGYRKMVTIITACIDLDMPTAPLDETSTTTNPVSQLLMEKRVNVWSIASGILPGTKWCGTGDIAKDYEDLGKERDVDKCCRAHDLCPTKVLAFRNRYGLVNWSFYSKSHCDCDNYFYDCLKKTGSPTAEAMGTFYFNVLRVQCVDDDTPGNEDSENRKLHESEVRQQF